MADKLNNSPTALGPDPDGLLPTPGVPVWVQCGRLRAVAYRDANGVWRSYDRGQELRPPVRMVAALIASRTRPFSWKQHVDSGRQMLTVLSCVLYPLASSDALPL